MAARDFQVYGLGQGCMDYLGKVATYPAPDTTGQGGHAKSLDTNKPKSLYLF